MIQELKKTTSITVLSSPKLSETRH